MMLLAKRKRSSDAVSDAGTSYTEQTEASTPREPADEKIRLLAHRREQHVAAKLRVEEQVVQVREQKQHVAVQLEQLEGCEGSRDGLGVSDLRRQLEGYEQQEQQALAELSQLDEQFEAAVAEILGIAAQQQPSQLAEAVQEQQQLQEVQAQQLAVEQQLGRADFAVTDRTKHQAKKARTDRISQVWDWLQDSSTAANGDAEGQQQQQQQQWQQGLQQKKDGVQEQVAGGPQHIQQQDLPLQLLPGGSLQDTRSTSQQGPDLTHDQPDSRNGVKAAAIGADTIGRPLQRAGEGTTHIAAAATTPPAAAATGGPTAAAAATPPPPAAAARPASAASPGGTGAAEAAADVQYPSWTPQDPVLTTG